MRRTNEAISKNRDGFTIIEVLIAIGIFSFTVIAISTMQFVAVNGNVTAMKFATASNWATGQIETLLALQYIDPTLNPMPVPPIAGLHLWDANNNGGPNQDQNGNGIDDDGVNTALYGRGLAAVNPDPLAPIPVDFIPDFGLDFTIDAAGNPISDGNLTSPDGAYIIYWNVADALPAADSKTVRVIVSSSDRGIPRTVSYTFVKGNF